MRGCLVGAKLQTGDNIPGNQPEKGIRPGGAVEICREREGKEDLSRAPAGARWVAGRSVPGVATPG
jgi:hypothetical protein